jgi:GAF domain-containing protein
MDQAAFVRSLQEVLGETDVTELLLERRVDDVLTSANKVLEADGAAFLLLDENGELRSIGTSGESVHLLEDLHVRLGIGPSLHAIAAGAPVAVSDLEDPDGHLYLGETVAGTGVRAVMAVPVTVRNTKVGLLNLYRSEVREWSGDEVRAGTAFATLLGLLMWVAESAYLYPPVRVIERLVIEGGSTSSAGLSKKEESTVSRP